MGLHYFLFQFGDYFEDAIGIRTEHFVHIAQDMHEDVIDVPLEFHILDNLLRLLIRSIRFNADRQDVE
jgi:hypothetical protein